MTEEEEEIIEMGALPPVIFWAHFTSGTKEAYRIDRFNPGRNSLLIFEWITEQKNRLQKETGVQFVMTNCGVIK